MEKKNQTDQIPDEAIKNQQGENTDASAVKEMKEETTPVLQEEAVTAVAEEVETAVAEEVETAVAEETETIAGDDADEVHDHDEDHEDHHEQELVTSIQAYEAQEGDEEDDDGEEEDDEGEDEGGAPPPKETEMPYDQLGREELVEKLESLVQEKEVPVIKSRVALIKVNFLKLSKKEKEEKYKQYIEEGGAPENFQTAEDPIETRFNEAFEIYKRNKASFLEYQEKIKLENLEKKKGILEQLKELINSEETLKKTYDDFKILQDQWKEIGLVPSSEVSDLWQSYHFLVEKFFDKVKINKELRDLDLKKNLEAKLKLCEVTEELLLEPSIIKSFKQLQKYHEEWKDIGPVPHEKRDEIWERFKTATDKINERRREHYDNLHEELQKNFIAKTALCEKAEELLSQDPATLKEWQEQTNQVNELFKIWRSIGRAPKKENNEVWNRFKSSLNTFFSNKKEYLHKIKDEQLHNYNMKLDICVQAENMKGSTDWKRTTQDLIRLQKEWKNIGPVPRKHADKIWKRFRAACDEFFNAKSSYYANIHEHEEENLKKKQEILDQLKNHDFSNDKTENLSAIKDYQRKWMEVGFVPINQKDKIQIEFRKVIDQHLNKLKINSIELQAENFKARFESVKGTQEGSRMLRKEQNFIIGRINKLTEEINLWENNIGFLANSQKANLLREEFEKKIEKAKKDLALLEAKLNYLKKA